MKEIVEKLSLLNKTISTMESCTGGAIANEITNIEGAGEVLKFSAVTYCNEFKIKMGVDRKVIDKYTVYSIETAKDMSKNISNFANSNYGIGITGQLNTVDKNNPVGEDNIVYISIYNRDKNTYKEKTLKVPNKSRKENKALIVLKIEELLLEELL